MAKSFGATVVSEPINQISRARNCGAKAANGKYLIFLDADTALSEQLLRETLELFDSGEIAGGVLEP
jgi:glycosyltransferase involved in cell wall biosynthesis